MDLQWRVGLPIAVDKVLSLVEHAVFSAEFDVALKTAVRNRVAPQGMMETAPMSTLVNEIDEALAASSAKADDGGEAPVESLTMSCRVSGTGGEASVDSDADLPKAVATAVAEALKKGALSVEDLDAFVQACWRKVDTHVVLIEEAADRTRNTERLKNTVANKLRWEPPQSDEAQDKKYVLFLYDLKNAGEASCHPATRIPPLQGNGEHLKSHIRAAMDSSHEDCIGPKDMYLLFDAGRPGPATVCAYLFFKRAINLMSETFFE